MATEESAGPSGAVGVAPEAEYAAFKVEQRGIDLIPDNERQMRPSGLFWLWAGAIWNVEYLVYGALIISFGLSFGQAVIAILIGNLAYAFLGWASIQGPLAGTTTFMISRAPFGQNGNRVVAFFNWLTQVGYETEGIVIIVLVLEAMLLRAGVVSGTGTKLLLIVLAAAVQLIMPFFGHATISLVLRYLAYVFIPVFVIMAILVVPKVHLGHLHQSASFAVWTTALVLLISAGGLGWTENANDYSRYLPRRTPKSSTFWSAAIGALIPSILLELLGAAAFVVSPSVTAVTGVPSAFASWFFWPFLILALPQVFCINTMDLYSSGVTLQALGVPIKRWGAVIVDTVIVAVVTGLVILRGNFYNDLAGFLLYIVVWVAPWFGIFIVDYLLRRGHYDPPALARRHGGIYWRNGGIHWPAIISLVFGMFAALTWINAAFAVPAYTGPLSNHFPGMNGGDLSWLIGIVVGGGVYYLIGRNAVRKEAELTPALDK